MRKFSKIVAQRGCMRDFSSVWKQNGFGCCQREDVGLAWPLSELLQLLVWSSLFFCIMKYLGKKKRILTYAMFVWCWLQQSRGPQLLVVQLVSYCHCTAVQFSYCHKILLSRLKTLRSAVNYFACSCYVWSLVHFLPQHAGQQIPQIHDKKHRSTELPGSCLTAQDCADTCLGWNSLKLEDGVFWRAAVHVYSLESTWRSRTCRTTLTDR